MEAYELRRMRRAHGLTTQQLAEIVSVPTSRVESWEASPGAPGSTPIEREARRRILRELALLRDRHLCAPTPPRFLPAGFTPSGREMLS